MSSVSPSKELEVDPEAQSGEDQDPELMEKEQQEQQGPGSGEFEVKEQDRWLPIANGQLHFLADLLVASDRRISRWADVLALSLFAQSAFRLRGSLCISVPIETDAFPRRTLL